jgi:heme oxygenase
MTLRSQLRSATATLHEQVDAQFSRYALHSRASYGAFLQAHARALFGLEAALEAAAIDSLLPDWHERRRRHLLHQDLTALALPVPLALPLQMRLDPDACWGLAYVLEGSRLGARLLLKRVCATPWPGQQAALNYLQQAGDSTLWPRFLSHLEQAEARLDPAAVTRGAQLGFAQFIAAAGDKHSVTSIDNCAVAAP